MSPFILAIFMMSNPAGAKIYSTPIMADNEEDLQSLYSDGVLDEADLEGLTELLNDPIDLNRASRNEIYDLPGVTLQLARAIVLDRKKNGPFTTEDELLGRVVGMDAEILEQLRIFAEARPLTREKFPVKGKLRSRAIMNFEAEDPDDPAVPGQSAYDVVPQAYVSARAEYAKKYETGILLMEGEGLNWMEYVPDRRTLYATWGRPMLSFGKAFVSSEQSSYKAIIGSYTAGFGLGLTFDDTSRTHPQGIYEDLMVSGTDSLSVRKGLFGAAGRFREIPLGEMGSAEATVFASTWLYDLYQYDAGTSDGLELDMNDPYRDNDSPEVDVRIDDTWVEGQYITIPNAYREDILGANTLLRIADQGQVGLTGYVGHMDRSVLPGIEDQWTLFPSSGFPGATLYGAAGLNGSWSLGFVDLFGEFAYSFTGGSFTKGSGGLLKAISDVGMGEIEGSFRYYGENFDNPHARGLAAADEYLGYRDRNEMGVRLKASLKPLDPLSTRIMGDLWKQFFEDQWNAEAYGQVRYQATGNLALTAFGDYRNRNLAVNGPGLEYGGDSYNEVYGDEEASDNPDDETLTDQVGPTEYDSYAGSKKYIGGQVNVDYIPRTQVTFLYKRIWEDTQYQYPSQETACEMFPQIGHYTWFKVRVAPIESTAVTARIRYDDEDLYSDQGDRKVEGYLQLDQKLPQRMKFSLRGTLGKDLDDPEAWFEDWCDQEAQYTYEDAVGATDSTTTESVPSLYGQARATFEWRF